MGIFSETIPKMPWDVRVWEDPTGGLVYENRLGDRRHRLALMASRSLGNLRCAELHAGRVAALLELGQLLSEAV